jgi:exodeoxyribonuclease-3
MKILTYNVNGIRSATAKGLMRWVPSVRADILCFQEIKAGHDQMDIGRWTDLGYDVYVESAEKRGYSGVAICSRIKPRHIERGCGMPHYDREGRVLRLDFDDLSVMSVYFPSGSSGEHRQDFKFQWLNEFTPYLREVRRAVPNLILCGDFNICHKPIDIHNPVSNKNSSGFLPEERQWMTDFLTEGYIDTFRHFHPEEPHQYTWWSFRANARKRNLGWRIDYHLATDTLASRLARCVILPEAKHSDHCPVLLELK